MSDISDRLATADEKLADLEDDTASIAEDIHSVVEEHAEVSVECDPTELRFDATVEYSGVVKLLNRELPDEFVALSENDQLTVKRLDLDFDLDPDLLSQRDLIKNVKQLISELEKQSDEGAPTEAVLNHASMIGMDRSKTEHEIDKLKQKGEVYSPSTDHLRTT